MYLPYITYIEPSTCIYHENEVCIITNNDVASDTVHRDGNSVFFAARIKLAARFASAPTSLRFESNASRVSVAAAAMSIPACVFIHVAYKEGVRPARCHGVCTELGAMENANIRVTCFGKSRTKDAAPVASFLFSASFSLVVPSSPSRPQASAPSTSSSRDRNTAARSARIDACAPDADAKYFVGNTNWSTARSSSAVSFARRSFPFSPSRSRHAFRVKEENTSVAKSARASPDGDSADVASPLSNGGNNAKNPDSSSHPSASTALAA